MEINPKKTQGIMAKWPQETVPAGAELPALCSGGLRRAARRGFKIKIRQAVEIGYREETPASTSKNKIH